MSRESGRGYIGNEQTASDARLGEFQTVRVNRYDEERGAEQIELQIRTLRDLASGSFGDVSLVETSEGVYLAQKDYGEDHEGAMRSYVVHGTCKKAGVPTFDESFYDGKGRFYTTFIGSQDGGELQDGDHILLGALQGGEAMDYVQKVERVRIKDIRALVDNIAKMIRTTTGAGIEATHDSILLDLEMQDGALRLSESIVGDFDAVEIESERSTDELREKNSTAVIGSVMYFCNEFNVPEEQVHELEQALIDKGLIEDPTSIDLSEVKGWDEI